MSVKSICVVSEGYPTPTDPQFSFVETLCIAFSKMGIDVVVISPQSILHHYLKGEELHPKFRRYSYDDGRHIIVYQPYVYMLPSRFWKYNDWAFKRVVTNTFNTYVKKIDTCYGHFWNSGYYISEVAHKNNIPLFVATGEGNFDTLMERYTTNSFLKAVSFVDGVICVSTANKNKSIQLGLTIPSKCKVFPNSIDTSIFKPLDKFQLRKEYGISQDDFIVAFVGSFINRKGPNRVSDAIMKTGANIKSFFIGGGQGPEDIKPTCEGVLFRGRLSRDELPKYLNMADVFVLPTLNEGCCNAIIEAMACGLPIISSDRDFNHDILTENNSILVDPMDIDAIAAAINTLYRNKELRAKFSEQALFTVRDLTIEKRCLSILDFINEKINENDSY